MDRKNEEFSNRRLSQIQRGGSNGRLKVPNEKGYRAYSLQQIGKSRNINNYNRNNNEIKHKNNKKKKLVNLKPQYK